MLPLATLLQLGCSGKPGSADDSRRPRGGPTPEVVPDTTAPGVSIVVEDEEMAIRIAVDDLRIYWMSMVPTPTSPVSRVRSCQKVDCPSTIVTYESTFDATLSSLLQEENNALAVGGSNVAWTQPIRLPIRVDPTVTILSCPSAGCGEAPTVIASNVALTALAIDETHAYWTSHQDTAILRRSLTGTGTTEAIALNETEFGQLRVNDTHAYWISPLGRPNGVVKRVVKQGGQPVETLVTEQNQPSALALDSDFFYWSNSYSVGTISRCPLTGCAGAPTVIVVDQDRPSPIVTDGKSIFWTKVADAPSPNVMRVAVMRCPIDGCASGMETLATQTLPQMGMSMAIDDSDVYWVVPRYRPGDGGGRQAISTIYRHPKNAALR